MSCFWEFVCQEGVEGLLHVVSRYSGGVAAVVDATGVAHHASRVQHEGFGGDVCLEAVGEEQVVVFQHGEGQVGLHPVRFGVGHGLIRAGIDAQEADAT